MRTRWACRLVFVTLGGGCGGTEPTPPPPPPPPPALSLTAVTPQSQSASAGQSLFVTVKVTTLGGSPVQGIPVTFAVTSGSGSVFPTLVVSNTAGLATAGWIIGTLVGPNTLAATVPNASPLEVTATGTPGPATAVVPSAGIGQTATVATTVGVPPAVTVKDQFGNGVPNVPVTFAVSGGGGSITGSIAMTNGLGAAAVGSWTLGTTSGANMLTATAAGLPTATIIATGTSGPAVKLAIQVPPIGGPSGVALIQQPGIQVVDQFGNLVAADNGRPVSATITPGGDGALTGTTVVSTVNGTATFGNLLIVGATTGSRSLTFSSNGLISVVSGAITLSASPPLTVTDVIPSVLTPGGVATILGTGFNVTPASNTVSVDGVVVAVSAASATQLSVTLPVTGFPCTPLHLALIAVANGPNSAASTRLLRVGTSRPLAVGEVQLLLTEPDLVCNELTSGGQYILTVFNPTQCPGSLGFNVRGGRFGAGPAPPNVVSSPALEPLRPTAPDRHIAHLEYERARYAQVGRAARTGTPAGGASLVTPTVGATSQVRFGFDGSATALLAVRTAFVGPHLIIAEDQAISPTFGVTPFDAFYAQLGNEFETRIYPILTTNFGNPLAMDAMMHNTGKILLVFTPSVNAIGGVAGFVAICDVMVVALCDASNEEPTAYLGLPGVGASREAVDFWKSDMLMVVQHEAKHITSLAEKVSRGAAALEETWLEEGTAEVAIEIYGRQICGFAPKSRTTYAALLACETNGTVLPPLPHVPDLIERLGFDFYDYVRQFEVASPFRGQTINGAFVPFHYESAWALAVLGGRRFRRVRRGLLQAPDAGHHQPGHGQPRGAHRPNADHPARAVDDDDQRR
jgi:hypothetical protein